MYGGTKALVVSEQTWHSGGARLLAAVLFGVAAVMVTVGGGLWAGRARLPSWCRLGRGRTGVGRTRGSSDHSRNFNSNSGTNFSCRNE
jgi:hypothetical protein